jgi:hypothetical protein
MSNDDRSNGGNVISLFGGPRPTTPTEARPSRTELQPVPEAPRYEDPRQDLGRRTLGKGTAQLGRRGGSVTYNLVTGMPASAVNLGELQGLLEGVVSDFEMAELSARWDPEVKEALQDVLLEWVQRLDAFELQLHESGVSISLQTQDDYGYYQYGLDVFPGRTID